MMPCIALLRLSVPRLVRVALCLFAAMQLALPAHAQGLESIMAPGKLIQGHAKYEDDCKQCHVKLDRKAQDGLCMACHKDIGGDVNGRKGYHGHLDQPVVCRTCHSDHKGRDVNTTEFDHAKFDHNKTNYTLKGRHEKVECAKCHVAGKKWREAPSDCQACHKKDDKHKGTLGPRCASCHVETDWKVARFDHDGTKFPLTGKHADVKCADCHRDNVYKDTPKNCYACHRKVDEQKGHKGSYGEKCDSCHLTKSWKPSTFNHDNDTRYTLRGKHRNAACKDCHTGNLYKDKLSDACYACHKKDDKHKETLGRNCESCHVEKSWKEVVKFDHDKTKFPLLGKHGTIECQDCHTSQVFNEAPKDCFSCHQKDDKHKANLGKACGDCHSSVNWKDTRGRFDHDKTRFALRHAHAAPSVKCAACHKDLQTMRGTQMACVACHRKDDKHEQQLGDKCDTCHNDKSWRGTSFDHARSRFALTGRHQIAKCQTCHATQRYKDAPRDCYSCHKNDDKHKQVFGMRCDTCHNTRSWAVWSFDHGTQTKYRLEGEHVKPACEACHKAVAPAGKNAAPLSVACISCHRANDVHGGSFGPRCEICHQVTGWKKFKNRPAAKPEEVSLNSRFEPGGLL